MIEVRESTPIIAKVYNWNCPYLSIRRDENGDTTVWECAIMTKPEQKYVGNCGVYDCPKSKKAQEESILADLSLTRR